MIQTAPAIPREENFGELTQLADLTRDFITACNDSVESGAAKFKIVQDYILKNTDLEEDQSITTIFAEIARISQDHPDIPTYTKDALAHVYASGYEESDKVLQTIAHIGEARRTGKTGRPTVVKN